MLGDKDANPTIAVKNLEAAIGFYEGKLGLTRIHAEQRGVALYKGGSSTIMVYESQFAGTNRATAVTWLAGGDVDEIVKALKAKGRSTKATSTCREPIGSRGSRIRTGTSTR